MIISCPHCRRGSLSGVALKIGYTLRKCVSGGAKFDVFSSI